MGLLKEQNWSNCHTDTTILECITATTVSDSISTTEEYFAERLVTENRVNKLEELLKKFDINIRTDYGNYRDLYDVLNDIAKIIYG